MNTIVIKVWRGLVSEVYCTDPSANVYIIDEDAGETVEKGLPVPLPEAKVY